MTQTAQPLLPTQGASPSEQRLLANLRELVRALVSSGAFLLRPRVSPVVLPRAGALSPALKWGDVNRVVLTADSSVYLPRVDAAHVGTPLYVLKLSDASALKLVPSGLGMGSRQAPRINDTADLTVTLCGLYVLMTDGQNWYIGAGPP